MTRYEKSMSQALAEVRQVNEGILSQLVRITRGLGSGDKDKKDMKTDGKGGFGIKDTKGKVIDFVDKERAKEILDFAAKKGYKISSPDKEPKTGRFEKELEKMVKAPMQRSLQMSQEEVELDEKYDLYHKTFSGAMQHAYDYAQKKLGITVDKNEIDRKVATGPRKPSEGKTNKYRLKGKGGNLQIQVYNKGGSKPFELNMYKEDLEIKEGTWAMADERGDAEKLKKLMSKKFKLGKDGEDATDQLYRLLGDDELFDSLYVAGSKNPNGDARPVIINWFKDRIKSNAYNTGADAKALAKKIGLKKLGESVELDEMDMKYVLINMQGKVQGYASDKKDALDIAKRTKSTMHPIKKKISDKTLEKMNALQKTPKELKDLGIIEEVEMNELKMNDPKLLKIFDKLKPKDTIKLKVSSGISKGKDLQPYTVRSKNTLRNGVEKITMILQGNPTGVKRFLYKKDGKVTFAIGDMAASIDDIKEALDKKDEPFVKDLVKKLRGGSKTHAKQADDLEKALKEKDGHFMYKDGEKVLVKTKADHDKYAKMGYSMNEMKMDSKQIDMLKKTFEPLRGKKISPSAGDKLMKIMDKIDKDKQTLIDLMKADIPFVSQLAVTRLISKHNMKGAEINKLKEIFNLDEALKGFKVEFGKGNTAGMAVYKDKKDAEAYAKRAPKPVKITQVTVKNANMFDDPQPTRKEDIDGENEMTEKLTSGNLSLKETVLKIWQEAVSPEQQAAIAISKKEKEKEKNKVAIEGKRGFIISAKKAKENGDKTFTFAGKEYDVEEVLKNDNTNDVSDDGDGLDKVQPKAVKKKFKDRKDKDIDNDGDVDSTDKYLHKRRKAISKSIEKESKKEEFSTPEWERYLQTKKGSLRDSILTLWGENAHSDDEGESKKKDLTKDKNNGKKKMTDTGKEVTPVDMSPKMPKVKNERNKL